MTKRCAALLLVILIGWAMTGMGLAAEKPVKIGFVYIMSGPFATYGQFAKQGAELAIDEINKAGGINGRKVEALFEDSTGKPDVGIRAIRKLVFENEVDVVMGLDSSGVASAVAPVMNELKTPLIITHAATPDVTGTKCNRYTFRVSLNVNQNIAMAAAIAADMKAKTWTTAGPDYSFGHQSWEYFQKYLSARKPDAVFLPQAEVAFSPAATTDFSAFITKIMNSKADGVLISLWGGNLIDFVRQAGDMGFFDGKREILMTLGAATEVLYALKDKMPEGIWVGTRYWFQANDTPVNKAFVDAYFKRFNVYPSYNAHGAYGAVRSYAAAAAKTKSVDKEKIIDGLRGLTIELPVGNITIRPEDHQAVTDGVWGKTATDPNMPIRILKPMRKFAGKEITPPVAETGCKMN
ncbi:MAG: ABC transporter substrate-binding protein [Desulfobacterales bacterium]|jgi:branched-chain amino acid transport system substrate-binding protein|nr:ABC transporter substrate-binding protein [Desulfobacterales bacterium]